MPNNKLYFESAPNFHLTKKDFSLLEEVRRINSESKAKPFELVFDIITTDPNDHPSAKKRKHRYRKEAESNFKDLTDSSHALSSIQKVMLPIQVPLARYQAKGKRKTWDNETSSSGIPSDTTGTHTTPKKLGTTKPVAPNRARKGSEHTFRVGKNSAEGTTDEDEPQKPPRHGLPHRGRHPPPTLFRTARTPLRKPEQERGKKETPRTNLQSPAVAPRTTTERKR